MMLADKLLSDRFLGLVIFFVVACYVAVIAKFAVNVPIGDDYAMLGFFQKWDAASLREKISVLFAPHNEHRLFFNRLLMLAQSRLTGKMDFRWQIFAGNAAMLLMLCLLIGRVLAGKSLFLHAVAVLMIVHMLYMKICFYPMAIVQSFFGMLFSVVYMLMVLDRKKYVYCVLVWMLATVTTGSGLFLFAVSFPVLCIQKRWSAVVGGAVVFIVMAFGYFLVAAENVGGGYGGKLGYLLLNPGKVLLFFFSITGSALWMPKVSGAVSYLPALCGIIVTGYYFYALARFVRESVGGEGNLPYLVFSGYFLLQIVMIVVGRAEVYGDDYLSAAHDGRYAIYGVMISALALTNAAGLHQSGWWGRKNVRCVMLILLMTYNFLWQFYGVWKMMDISVAREVAMEKYLKTGNADDLDYWAIDKDQALLNLNYVIRQSLYDFN